MRGQTRPAATSNNLSSDNGAEASKLGHPRRYPLSIKYRKDDRNVLPKEIPVSFSAVLASLGTGAFYQGAPNSIRAAECHKAGKWLQTLHHLIKLLSSPKICSSNTFDIVFSFNIVSSVLLSKGIAMY